MAERIPCLDGLRAASIAAVLFAHAVHAVDGMGALAVASRLAGLGVRVFFVLSGYLITTLLVREYERTGAISYRAFVWRRVTRILPAYVAYLLVVWLTLTPPIGARWWPALTYTSNVFTTGWWQTGHTWSLSVEEQFYLTWPLLFAFGPRRARQIALVVFAISPLIRTLVFLVTRNGSAGASWCHDFIAAGALLALTYPKGFAFRWSWLAPIMAVILTLIFEGGTRWIFAAQMTVGMSVEALAVVVSVAWCLARPASLIGRVLEWRPIRALGLISYSLYLWQELFLYRGANVWFGIPAALIAATASYWAIERPGLALRRAFRPMREAVVIVRRS